MPWHRGIVASLRILTWNLFHGRDAPPDPALTTWRSRLLRTTETGATHAQVNRPLFDQFAAVLDRDPWQVAMLQEAPPRWLRRLCLELGAHGASALTARNLGSCVRAWLAERNPDLLMSAEGGSNQLLVRPPWRIVAVRRLTLTLRPQRRRMLWARLERPGGSAICVATLHATAADEVTAARDVERGAEHALRWAGRAPLVLGGDLNLRPRSAGAAFDRLSEVFGLTRPTAPDAIDHILVRGLELASPSERLPPGWRELPYGPGLRLRLSDHDAVAVEIADPPGADAASAGGRSPTGDPLAR
jgi:endonuclease/exonuclease/phosphatase family metal-dependent hydrolase